MYEHREQMNGWLFFFIFSVRRLIVDHLTHNRIYLLIEFKMSAPCSGRCLFNVAILAQSRKQLHALKLFNTVCISLLIIQSTKLFKLRLMVKMSDVWTYSNIYLELSPTSLYTANLKMKNKYIYQTENLKFECTTNIVQ